MQVLTDEVVVAVAFRKTKVGSALAVSLSVVATPMVETPGESVVMATNEDVELEVPVDVRLDSKEAAVDVMRVDVTEDAVLVVLDDVRVEVVDML